MKRALVDIDSIKNINRPTENGENVEVTDLFEMILDNWRKFTPKQRGIAATLSGYVAPAEQMSRAQAYNMDLALKLAKELKIV